MPAIVRKNVPLAPLTTLRIGGPAEYFAEVHTLTDLRELIDWADSERLPLFVLGQGSNVLISDEGIRGLTIQMNIRGISYEPGDTDCVQVKASAGEPWDALVEETTKKGLWGLENLSGIPGRVGAAPIQNINAYGVAVADTIVSIQAYHVTKHEFVTIDLANCRFGYRDSYFKSEEGKRHIITGVTFQLSRTQKAQTAYKSSRQSIERYLHEHDIETPTAEDIRDAIISVRRNIGMLEGMYRSAGSFFKNTVVPSGTFEHIESIVKQRHSEKEIKFSPWYWKLPDGRVKISTAFLMECTSYNKDDFKGKVFNERVGISPMHTLSLINVESARAEDMKAFVVEIIDTIKKEFGIEIETEVCFIF